MSNGKAAEERHLIEERSTLKKVVADEHPSVVSKLWNNKAEYKNELERL